MSDTEYTPSTREVRMNTVWHNGKVSEVSLSEFDRWFEGVIREAKAEALREAVEYVETNEHVFNPSWSIVKLFLERRADVLEGSDDE